MGDGGVEIRYGDFVLHDLASFRVCLTIAKSALDPTAGKKTGEGLGIVVAAVVPLFDDVGRAAEFGGQYHQCLIE